MSIAAKRNELKEEGFIPRRSFAASLAVTMTLLLVPTSLAQTDTSPVGHDAVAVEQAVDVNHADTGGGGPPDDAELLSVWIKAVGRIFMWPTREIHHCWRYSFSWPDPPPSDILKVPIFVVAHTNLFQVCNPKTSYHEKPQHRPRSHALFHS
jgi:hypothetical protein